MMPARLGVAFYWACMLLVAVLIVTGGYEFWRGVNDPQISLLRALTGPARCLIAAVLVGGVGMVVRRLLPAE